MKVFSEFAGVVVFACVVTLLGHRTDLTLEKAVKICQASESAKAQIKTLSNESETVEVDAVQCGRPKSAAKKRDYKPKQQQESGNCERCGFRHVPKQCPAFGKDCRKCGGKNHFAKCCLSKKKVQLMEKQSDSDEVEKMSFFVDAIEEGRIVSKDEWIAYLDVNGTDIPLKLDTGAQVNILPMKDFKRLKNKPKVRDKKINLRTYDDKPIPSKGVCRLSLTTKGQKVNALFVLVEVNRQAILGLKACEQLGLIKRINVIDADKVTVQEQTKKVVATAIMATHSDWVREYSEVFKSIIMAARVYAAARRSQLLLFVYSFSLCVLLLEALVRYSAADLLSIGTQFGLHPPPKLDFIPPVI